MQCVIVVIPEHTYLFECAIFCLVKKNNQSLTQMKKAS